MTVTPEVLIGAKLAENSQTTQYTAQDCKALIDKFTATNNGATDVIFSVNLVKSGDVHSLSNRVLSERTIAPGESYGCPEIVGHLLDPDDYISTLTDTAGALTIRSSGREIT